MRRTIRSGSAFAGFPLAWELLHGGQRKEAAMWSMKKILVPTDFSKPSEMALDAAILMARKFDAAIVLMHAYQVPVYPYPGVAGVMPLDMVDHVEHGARKALQTAASSHGDSGVSITTMLKAGAAWEQIIRAAKEIDAGLIVIGSRGLSGLPRALLGSTAERVVRYSPIPVLAFHSPLPVTEEDRSREGAKAANDLVDRWLI
jgi:nucleotide-binding universal stress UspA family protein